MTPIDTTPNHSTDGYRLPTLDRTGFIAGFGIGEVLVVGIVLSVLTIISELTGLPNWIAFATALVVGFVVKRSGPGGLHLAEYWPILVQRLKRRHDTEWTATSAHDRPPSTRGIEFGAMEVKGLAPGDILDPNVLDPTGERLVGYVFDTVAGTLSVCVELRSDSFLMLDQAEQAATLESWARVLTTANEGTGGTTYLSTTIIASQGSPADHRHYLEAQRRNQTPAATIVTRSYDELLAHKVGEAGDSRILLTASLSLQSRSTEGDWGTEPTTGASSRARLIAEGARRALQLHQRLNKLGWPQHRFLSPVALRQLEAECVDPETRLGRAAHRDRSLDAFAGITQEPAPPTHVVRPLDYVIINGVCHWTGWASRWPSESLPPDWFIRFLGTYQGSGRTTVYYHPVDRGDSLDRYRADLAKHTAEQHLAQEKGRPVSIDTQIALAETHDRGDQFVRGHRELQACALVSLSASTPEQLRVNVDAFLAHATGHGITMFNLKGAQELAWAHSLPFGLSPVKLRNVWS